MTGNREGIGGLRCKCGRDMERVPWFDGIAYHYFWLCNHCCRATNNGRGTPSGGAS